MDGAGKGRSLEEKSVNHLGIHRAFMSAGKYTVAVPASAEARSGASKTTNGAAWKSWGSLSVRLSCFQTSAR